MITIIEMVGKNMKGPLYNNPSNQLRRAIGPYEVIYRGGVEGGTVRSLRDDLCYDWWPTDTKIEGKWYAIRVVAAT